VPPCRGVAEPRDERPVVRPDSGAPAAGEASRERRAEAPAAATKEQPVGWEDLPDDLLRADSAVAQTFPQKLVKAGAVRTKSARDVAEAARAVRVWVQCVREDEPARLRLQRAADATVQVWPAKDRLLPAQKDGFLHSVRSHFQPLMQRNPVPRAPARQWQAEPVAPRAPLPQPRERRRLALPPVRCPGRAAGFSPRYPHPRNSSASSFL
jgi:hypothetical protein